MSFDKFFGKFGSYQPLEPLGPFNPFEPLNPIRRRPMPKRPFEVSQKAALKEIVFDSCKKRR